MAVSAESIKETQESLGKIIKKPPLTDKLLTKPPFRFLHDVFSVVIKDTGALQGLFDESEMNSENVKDKDSKVEYLTKIINCLSLATGQSLQVKPGKIVSGQEADKTNELLQLLATVINNNVDTSDAVKRVRNGEKPSKAKKGSKKKDDENKSPKKDKSPEKTPKKNKEDKENKVEKENNKNASRTSKSRKDRSPSPQNIMNGLDAVQEQQESLDLIANGIAAPTETEPLVNGFTEKEDNVPVMGQSDSMEQQDPLEDIANSVPSTRGSSAASRPRTSTRPQTSSRPQTTKEKKKKPKSPSPEPIGTFTRQASEEAAEPQVLGSTNDDQASPAPTRPTTAGIGRRAGSARPKTGRLKSARPPSARPAAPSIKKRREIAIEDQPRPLTAKVANVILDNDDDNEDDGEEFLIEEAPKDHLVSLDPDPLIETAAVESGGQEHGALVQQILETQKELQDGNKRPQSPKKGVEIEREAGVGEAGRARDRESTQKEVNKLRGSIQTLTRSANPLGKLMDFLQEDVDSMQRELDQWRKENKTLQLELKHEESMTTQTLQPLITHLDELTSAVSDQLDKISMVKSNILKNEEKIEKMVGSIGLTHK